MNIDLILQQAKDPQTKYNIAYQLYKTKPNYWHWLRIYNYIDGYSKRETWWDNMSMLHAIANIETPKSYLEVGTLKGGTLSQFIIKSPNTECLCFDLWPSGYAVMADWKDEPSSPEYVMEEMKKFSEKPKVTFISGDSHVTLKEYFQKNPNEMFDVASVDGDHTEDGARKDLEDVLPHTNCIVFDDIIHPSHKYLEKVWDEMYDKYCKNWLQFRDHHFVGSVVAFKP